MKHITEDWKHARSMPVDTLPIHVVAKKVGR
jgi:hypothetical protein